MYDDEHIIRWVSEREAGEETT